MKIGGRESLARCEPTLLPSLLSIITFAVLITVALHDNDARGYRSWLLFAVGSAIALSARYYVVLRRSPHQHTTLLGVVYANVVVALAAITVSSSLFLQPIAQDRTSVPYLVLVLGVSGIVLSVSRSRRDLFCSFQIPLVSVAAIAYIGTDIGPAGAIAAIAALYLAALAIIHVASHRGALNELVLEAQTRELAMDLAVQNERLQMAYEALSDSNMALETANSGFNSLNRTLLYQATHDPLTLLLNRRGALEQMTEVLDAATDQTPMGLLYIDLDHFKMINDLVGHRGGDQFLAAIADRLQRSLSTDDFAGRIGGDEFIAILPNRDLAESTATARRLVEILRQPVHAEGREVPSSVSIGVTAGPQAGADADDLLQFANAALHHAKGAGRNRVEVFDRAVRQHHERRAAEVRSVRRAIEDGDIVPYFQPEIDAATGRVLGAEILARWLVDGRAVPAVNFIEIIERAASLERLTQLMVAQSRPMMRRLISLGLPTNFRFRLNLAPTSTDGAAQSDALEELLDGIEPDVITVDVAEGAVMHDLAAATTQLHALRDRGVRVCLDDFARGHSSLSLLRTLPIDEVRIDRVCVDALPAAATDRAIVRAVIGLVKELGLDVSADGVESPLQADALLALGCSRHQGLFYSAALPAAEFEHFLNSKMVEGITKTPVSAMPGR